MKEKCYVLLVLFLVLVISGCTTKKKLIGKWGTVQLIKQDKSQRVINSYIVFETYGKGLKAKGDAGVNLYNMNVYIKGKNFTASEMVNTGFSGFPEDMEFEDMFFDVIMNSKTYRIENEILFITAPDKDMEIHFKRE